MGRHRVATLCAEYAEAADARARSGLLRQVRYALERVGADPPSRSEMVAAWADVTTAGALEAHEAAALTELCRAYLGFSQHDLVAARRHVAAAAEAAVQITDGARREPLSLAVEVAALFGACEARELPVVLESAADLRGRCQAVGLPDLVAETWHLEGLAHRRSGAPDAAETPLLTAIERFTRLGDKLAAARAEDTLGMVLMDRGQFAAALQRLHHSLLVKTERRDLSGRAMTCGNLGRLHLQFEEYAAALPFLEQDLALTEQLDDQTGRLIALTNLVEALIGQGEQTAAMRRLSEARALGVGDAVATAHTNHAAAWLSIAKGEYEVAADLHHQVRDSLPNPLPLVAAHLDLQLGVIEAGRANYGLARQRLEAAITSFEQLRQPGRVAKAQFELALVMLRQDLRAEAVIHLVAALDGARALQAQAMADRFAAAVGPAGVEPWVRAVVEVKAANQALTEQLRAAESLIAEVAHDVTSPLGSIVSVVDLAASLATAEPDDDELEPDLPQLLQNVAADCRRVIDLGRSIVDAPRLEPGVLVPTKPVEVGPLVDGWVGFFQRWVKAKDNGLWVIAAPDNQDLTVMADPELLSRVLMNLMNNAAKYTRRREEPVDDAGHLGLITVGVRQSGSAARISVTDTGQGIPSEYRPRLFTRYGQVNTGFSKISSGLGLYFCERAVRSQGGVIDVDTEVGRGSTFWFELPLG